MEPRRGRGAHRSDHHAALVPRGDLTLDDDARWRAPPGAAHPSPGLGGTVITLGRAPRVGAGAGVGSTGAIGTG